jgi:HD-GYP domain-containing protein (c-di-GMP phosphodiesterase class II)
MLASRNAQLWIEAPQPIAFIGVRVQVLKLDQKQRRMRVSKELDYLVREAKKSSILPGTSTDNIHHCRRAERHTVERASLILPQNVCWDDIAVLASAIEAHEPSSYGHPRRVAHLAQAIGRALGWEKKRVTTIEIGALLHDMGKIAISDAILKKPGPLTEEEFNEVKRHPEAGARLLAAGNLSIEAAIPYALYHHERYDGRGYPYGLAGEDIPIEGRILAVADTFEALISDRPYRKKMEPELALEIIERSAGSQFDPNVVAAFLKAWDTGQIQILLETRRTEKQAHPLELKDIVIGIPAEELVTL